ncbi:hypothetical protein ACN22W_28110 [Burkholderia theae]|uniref:hypothetical protein n=1 Tax=Burkholderia theae TaxID=3143496 RepID=UPI003AFA4211
MKPNLRAISDFGNVVKIRMRALFGGSGAADVLDAGGGAAGRSRRVGIAQAGVHLAWEHLRAGTLKVVLRRHHVPGTCGMGRRALKASCVQGSIDYLLDAFAGNESLLCR